MNDTTTLGSPSLGREINPCPREQFGSWLREARETRGFTVEAIAQETKISKLYILGLETGKLEALPGKVFGRGFVKNITRLLKTDGSEALRLYDACWDVVPASAREFKPLDSAASFKNNGLSFFKTKSSRPEKITFPLSPKSLMENYLPLGGRRRTSGSSAANQLLSNVHLPTWLVRGFSPQVRLWVLGSVAFVFVSLVFGRWAASHIHQSKLATTTETVAPVKALLAAPVVTSEVESSNAPAINAVQEVATPAAMVQSASIENREVQPSQVAAAEPTKNLLSQEDNPLYLASAPTAAFEQVLELNVSGPVEIRVTLDGKKQERSSFTPDAYRFTFNDRAEIYIVDASLVSLIYNGKSLGVLGSKGRKRRVMFQGKAGDSDFPK